MLVPETTADVDDLTEPGQDYVWLPWKCADMEAVAVAPGMDELADDQFG